MSPGEVERARMGLLVRVGAVVEAEGPERLPRRTVYAAPRTGWVVGHVTKRFGPRRSAKWVPTLCARVRFDRGGPELHALPEDVEAIG